MKEFMKIILSLSVSGTLLFLFIFGLKPLYKNKFSRRWQYYIWVIVALRFLLPFSPSSVTIGSLFVAHHTTAITNESPASSKNINTPIYVPTNADSNGRNEMPVPLVENKTAENRIDENVTAGSETAKNKTHENVVTESETVKNLSAESETAENVTAENETTENETVENVATENKSAENRTIENIAATTTTSYHSHSIWVYLFFVWAALALGTFIRKITNYQGFLRYIKFSSIEVSDIKTLNLLSDCKEKLNIKTRAELYHNALIVSPIMTGFFHPSIILPANKPEDKALSCIFIHELLHYKQKDMFYKWFIQIVICLHWFNPFVYLLEKEVNRACELSCDEAVISILGDGARREYGDTLISFLRSSNPYKDSFASVPLTEGAKQLKERLGAIMNFKKKTKTIQILTGFLTLCILLGAAFTGIYPVTAAATQNPAVSSNPPTAEKKNYKTGTYVYDEELGFGWYLDDVDEDSEQNWADEDSDGNWDWDDTDSDDDWDWDDKNLNDDRNWNSRDLENDPNNNQDLIDKDSNFDQDWDNKNLNFNWDWDNEDFDFDWDWDNEDSDFDWDWDDEDFDSDWDWDDEDFDSDWDWDNEDSDSDWDWDDKALIDAYASFGIEKNGKSYYYQGELVNIIKDQRPDCSFYMLDINSEGTASIKIIRNAESNITGVSYMTEQEVAELLERAVGRTEKIPAVNTKEWDCSTFSTLEASYTTDDVYIFPSATNNIILKEYLTEDQPRYYANTDIKNNTLIIRSGDRPTTNYSSYIEIYIPDAILRSIKIQTTSGDIALNSYTGTIALSTISGDIEVSNSDIAGNINTISGEIELSPTNLSGDLYVSSHSGDIFANFPTSIHYNLKAQTGTGRLAGTLFSGKPKNKKEFSKAIGKNPKFTVTLQNFSGDIDIN